MKKVKERCGVSFSIYFKTNAILRKVGQRAESGVFVSFLDSLVFFVAIFLFVLCRLFVVFSEVQSVCVLNPEQNRTPLNCAM